MKHTFAILLALVPSIAVATAPAAETFAACYLEHAKPTSRKGTKGGYYDIQPADAVAFGMCLGLNPDRQKIAEEYAGGAIDVEEFAQRLKDSSGGS